MSFSVYDLSYCPETFDFLTFFCAAKTVDPDTEIVFVSGQRSRNKKFKDAERLARFNNILVATCELFKSKYRVVNSWNGECVFPSTYPKSVAAETYFLNVLFDLYREHGRIYKLSAPREKQGHITITIRNSRRNEYRNNNLEQWKIVREQISKTHEVIWIDDYFTRPIRLSERARLYESAGMNLFVSNGPASFGLLSEIPYMVFKMITHGGASREHLALIGLPEGSQCPWRNKNQKLIWEDDKADIILKHFSDWNDLNK